LKDATKDLDHSRKLSLLSRIHLETLVKKTEVSVMERRLGDSSIIWQKRVASTI
jgi:hypothetical protein